MSTSSPATEVARTHQDDLTATHVNTKSNHNGLDSLHDLGRSPTISDDPSMFTGHHLIPPFYSFYKRPSNPTLEAVSLTLHLKQGTSTLLKGSGKRGTNKLTRKDTGGKDVKDRKDADPGARTSAQLTPSPALDPLSHVCFIS